MLATALGAMVYGPVVAIPAAMISDTVGFMIYPTGDYFLPFMLTEIASTMIYALFLYRAKVSPIRVMLARFGICMFINVVLQQMIYAWYYVYIGNPEEAKESIMGILTVTRIFKNLALFPIEAVVMTLFLRVLMPVARRAKLIYCPEADMKFNKKQIVVLILLICVWAMLGYPGREMAWIFARQPDMDKELYKELATRLRDEYGVNTDKLKRVPQHPEQVDRLGFEVPNVR
jgi:ECF transporter S component (folate family)